MTTWINRSKIDPRYYVIHSVGRTALGTWRHFGESLAVVDDFGNLQSVAK